jgi:hypothetical protein
MGSTGSAPETGNSCSNTRDFSGLSRLVHSQSGARRSRCLRLGSVARITVAIVGSIDLGLACL